MKILSINAGSSSLKFGLFNMETNTCISSGLFERIGLESSSYTIKLGEEKVVQEAVMETHVDAVKLLLDKLISLEIIKGFHEINGVGHRVVHGKDKYSSSVVINDLVIADLEEFSEYAPLHNSANVMGIKAFREVLPEVLMVAVFDTAFHQSVDKVNYLYPVPLEWNTKYGVRKYGFHGTSHRYIAQRVKSIFGESFKQINCHLGQGGSICAIKDGVSVDTTMGFTPLSGIMMGTRSGDVDPSIITYIMEKEGMNASEVIDSLNKKSGLLGMSELSNDMRDVLEACDNGNEKAIIARDKFVRRVVDYIASYYVMLGGVDVITFTAGIGENSIPVRRMICEELACLGIKIDLDKNNIRGEEVCISTDDSSVKVMIIPTDEELMIAMDTEKFIK